MATAISSMLFGRGRHPHHERLETSEDEDANSLVEEAPATATGSTSNNNNSDSLNTQTEELIVETIQSDDEDAADEDDVESPTTTVNTTDTAEEEEEDEGYLTHAIRDSATATATTNTTGNRSRNTVTLAELEEERELARRRTSACVLLSVFVLFRLWITALQDGDVFVMMLCLFGTSWTARLIRHNREREEALDERIRTYLENADPNTTEIDRNDLRFLSFQAQLALAMMESQRQMAAGGYGHPDGQQGSQGLSEEAKHKWERFQFKDTEDEKVKMKKGDYGAVAQKDVLGYEEDGPHCSICLGEYEDGETLVKLTCKHIYHEDCIGSWTTNHTRCPLCNCDLESATSEGTSTQDESIV